jgi:plasmid stability protein
MLWRHFGGKFEPMPSIQIKDVPDQVHAVLRRRAATAGQSLQEYLRALLVDETSQPTLDEVLDRAAGRAGGRISFASAAAAVRADRDRGR